MDEELTENINSSPSHSLTIDVPGSGEVYKSMLVTLLNTGDNLSKARLRAVQAPTFIGSSNTDSVNLSHTDGIPDDKIHLHVVQHFFCTCMWCQVALLNAKAL